MPLDDHRAHDITAGRIPLEREEVERVALSWIERAQIAHVVHTRRTLSRLSPKAASRVFRVRGAERSGRIPVEPIVVRRRRERAMLFRSVKMNASGPEPPGTASWMLG